MEHDHRYCCHCYHLLIAARRPEEGCVQQHETAATSEASWTWPASSMFECLGLSNCVASISLLTSSVPSGKLRLPSSTINHNFWLLPEVCTASNIRRTTVTSIHIRSDFYSTGILPADDPLLVAGTFGSLTITD